MAGDLSLDEVEQAIERHLWSHEDDRRVEDLRPREEAVVRVTRRRSRKESGGRNWSRTRAVSEQRVGGSIEKGSERRDSPTETGKGERNRNKVAVRRERDEGAEKMSGEAQEDGKKMNTPSAVVQMETDPFRPHVTKGNVGRSLTRASSDHERSNEKEVNRAHNAAYTESTFVEEFRSEVEHLGSSQFKGKKRKEWEHRTLIALGARAPKRQKVPLGILKGMRRAEKIREMKEREHLRASQMLTKKTKRKGGSQKLKRR